MNNILFGIFTIIVCTIGYYYSWKYKAQNNFKIAVLLLIVCGLVLRIYMSADFFLHSWDERYHALVAKNLIDHPLTPTLYDNPILPYDFRNWTANHYWVHKQPLPLWSMALSMWIFGVNEIALRLPSILLSTLGIWLTFSIASSLFDKKTGFLAAFLYSVNGLIIELTGGKVATDHIDIFFLFFIELAVFFSIRFALKRSVIYNLMAGFSIGAAILSKWLPALIVLPIWLLIIADSNNFTRRQVLVHFVILISTFTVIVIPLQIYIFNVFSQEAKWAAGFNLKHITEVLEERTGPWYYFIDRLRINYGELIYLPLIWFIWKNIKNFNDKKKLAVLLWFMVPLLFFSIAKTKMQGYILFISPALFIITASFWHMLADYKTNPRYRWLFNVILILLIALPIRYSIERLKPFNKSDRNPQWVINLKELNKKQIRKGVLFNYDKPIEAMFYTDLTAYSVLPDKKMISDLTFKGYTVIINEQANNSSEIKSMKGVIFVNLNSVK